MKKVICMILSALMVLSLFVLTGCKRKPDVLHVCVDLGLTHTGPANLETDIYDLIYPLESYDKSLQIEVEYIPNYGSERKAVLTRLRTEIMSGEGPDVFIMECIGGTHLYEEDVLFPMPEKVMEAGVFLPLDDYIVNSSEYADWGSFTSVVLNAGKNDEGQQIIPIVYTLPAVYSKSEDAPHISSTNMFWGNLLEDETLYDEAALLAGEVTDYGLCDFRLEYVLGDVADYEQETLDFTEEELLLRVNELLELSRFSKENGVKEIPNRYEGYIGKYSNKSGWVEMNGLHESDELAMLPLYSDDGGCTAIILGFAAVNRNSKCPEKAFKIIDRLVSKSMMQKSPLYEEYFYHSTFGVPIDEEVMSEQYPLRLNNWSLSEENYNALNNVRGQITNAEFGGSLQIQLERLMYDCYKARTQGEEIDEIVHRAYETMKRTIGE